MGLPSARRITTRAASVSPLELFTVVTMPHYCAERWGGAVPFLCAGCEMRRAPDKRMGGGPEGPPPIRGSSLGDGHVVGFLTRPVWLTGPDFGHGPGDRS